MNENDMWSCEIIGRRYGVALDIFEIYHLPVGWYYENHYYHSFDPCHDLITHWMPLPEPPEVSE